MAIHVKAHRRGKSVVKAYTRSLIKSKGFKYAAQERLSDILDAKVKMGIALLGESSHFKRGRDFSYTKSNKRVIDRVRKALNK